MEMMYSTVFMCSTGDRIQVSCRQGILIYIICCTRKCMGRKSLRMATAAVTWGIKQLCSPHFHLTKPKFQGAQIINLCTKVLCSVKHFNKNMKTTTWNLFMNDLSFCLLKTDLFPHTACKNKKKKKAKIASTFVLISSCFFSWSYVLMLPMEKKCCFLISEKVGDLFCLQAAVALFFLSPLWGCWGG